MSDSEKPLYQLVTHRLRSSVSTADLEQKLKITSKPRESIFDAVVRHGLATDHRDAVRFIASAFPPPEEAGYRSWMDAYKYLLGERAERREKLLRAVEGVALMAERDPAGARLLYAHTVSIAFENYLQVAAFVTLPVKKVKLK